MAMDTAVELSRSTAVLAVTLAVPVLLVGVGVGLVVSFFQSLTQIQDPTISLVPRMLVMLTVAVVLLPWSLTRLVEFSTELIRNIPGRL